MFGLPGVSMTRFVHEILDPKAHLTSELMQASGRPSSFSFEVANLLDFHPDQSQFSSRAVWRAFKWQLRLKDGPSEAACLEWFEAS